jgi:hypothetical protein
MYLLIGLNIAYLTLRKNTEIYVVFELSQCCGSGSTTIRNFFPDPDPGPLGFGWIRIHNWTATLTKITF